jgi:hypothetical protein
LGEGGLVFNVEDGIHQGSVIDIRGFVVLCPILARLLAFHPAKKS